MARMATRARITDELPPDILFDILKLLPLESLCRLRCVSRMWRTIIDDPCFLAAQYACSISRSRLLLLFSAPFYKDALRAYSIDYPQQLDDCVQTPAFHGEHGWPECRDHIHQQPFQGLYCADFVHHLQIWNVITGGVYFHVKTEVKTVQEEAEEEREYHIGFDPVGKKHKIMSVWRDYDTGRITRNRVFDVEENSWRSARNDLPPGIGGGTILHMACIDGFIFYSLDREDTGLHYLVAFHVGSERLRAVKVPEEAREAGSVLTEFDGHADLGYLDGSTIDLWILDDVENQVWRLRTFTVPWREEDYDPELIRLQSAATPAGELLLAPEMHMTMDPVFFVFIYNVEHNVLRRIELPLGLPEYILTLRNICYYAERRHPLPGLNRYINSVSQSIP